MRQYARDALLIALPFAAVLAAGLLDALPQDPAYHRFADTRRWLAIPNALNVLSNLPFLFVGAAGLATLHRSPGAARSLCRYYGVFFVGVLLTSAGSGWYHLAPDTARLAWDRLPMTLAFMALTALVLAEFVSATLARRLFPWLLAAGAASVAWWAATEARLAGDLRPYVLVQFVPLLVIPLVLLLYAGERALKHILWGMLGLYLLAKACEAGDATVFAWGERVSGHTLKHLLAAAATWLLLRDLRRRDRRVTAQATPPR